MDVRVDGGRGATWRIGTTVLILSAVAAVLGLSASPAKATSYQRPYKEVLGSVEQPSFSAPYPQALAVDPNTGDLLVVDSVTQSIARFHANGTESPFSALGSNRIDGKRGAGGHTAAECETAPEPESCDETPQNGLEFKRGGAAEQQIAIDGAPGATNGDIYVTQKNQNLVDIFSSSGRYIGQITTTTLGALPEPCGLAVDSSGALYVSSYSGRIYKYVPSGNPVVNSDDVASFPVKEYSCNMSAGTGVSAGWLFSTNGSGTSKVNESTGETTEFASIGYAASVDPTTGDPILGQIEGVEFDGSLSEATVPLSRLVPEHYMWDFAVNDSSEVYVALGFLGSQLLVYGQPAVVATVTAKPATNVTGTRATLQGIVNPSGLEVTDCFIEWGPTVSYGHKEQCEGLPAGAADSKDHAVHIRVSGLTANGTPYHFRVSATDEHGTETSEDQVFVTAHTVITEQASDIATESATLNGTLRPEGVAYSECEFDWELASHAGYEHHSSCVPSATELEAGFTAQPVSVSLTGLKPDTAYRFRVSTDQGDGEAEEFTTLGAPRISEVRGLNATKETVLLEAKINPSGFRTAYRFEWGPTSTYGNEMPVAFEPSIGSGTSPVLVTAPLTGLSPGATYHYRVVATSEVGGTASPDHEVETLNACGLPEHRCLELVSPRSLDPVAAPGRFGVGIELHYQASEASGSLAYVVEAGLADASKGGEVLYQGVRSVVAGWRSSLLSPPTTARNEQPGIAAAPSEFLGLSRDLTCGVVVSPQPLRTEDPAAERIAEIMDKAGGANLYQRSANGTYKLITEVPPEELKRQSNGLSQEFKLVGMSSNCSTVLFSTENHYSGLGGAGNGSRLYEWREGRGLQYLGWIPGEPDDRVAEATAGVGNVLSEDGSRAFFMADRVVAANPAEVGKQGVFVREDGVQSMDVSMSETSTPDTGATFQRITPEGSRVYFTANAGLTSTSSEAGTTDLYEYDFEKPDGQRLADLSATPEPGGAAVQAVVGVAADGSHAYFTSPGQLVPGRGKTRAQNEVGQTLSLYDSREGELQFVATVPASNAEFNGSSLAGQSARVSPTGQYLLFEAKGSVTGYESGSVPQAYLYDAADSAEPTVCVSCRQDGAPSVNPPNDASAPLARVVGVNPLYQPQSLVMRNGMPVVFFVSRDRLAPAAVRGTVNLYEWAHGQVFLIASEPAGYAPKNESVLVFGGAGAGGEDLYFFDPAALNWENPEGRYAAWDARVGGGFAKPGSGPGTCDPSSESGSDSCNGAITVSPTAPAVRTTGFYGQGNVKSRHGASKKKHHKKHHRKHYGRRNNSKGKKRRHRDRRSEKTRSANRNRRAGK